MDNREIIEQLVDFISDRDGNTDKSRLQNAVQETFDLVKERSVYYCECLQLDSANQHPEILAIPFWHCPHSIDMTIFRSSFAW